MKIEDKELLLKDLCGRLPYGVRVEHKQYDVDAREYFLSNMSRHKDRKVSLEYERRTVDGLEAGIEFMDLDKDRPYLRPMDSMTNDEKREYIPVGRSMSPDNPNALVDWLNAHHFDYRGLIKKGLAIEAPKGMYKTE